MLTGYSEVLPPIYARQERKPEEKILELPERNADIVRARRYLRLRGIDDIVIDYCNMHEMIFEDTKYHNCIFLGFDGDTPKYGAVRSTYSDFKGDLPGSDNR